MKKYKNKTKNEKTKTWLIIGLIVIGVAWFNVELFGFGITSIESVKTIFESIKEFLVGLVPKAVA